MTTDASLDAIAEMFEQIDDGRKNYGILVDRKVVAVTMAESFMWALKQDALSVQVARDEIGEILVSTIFLSGPMVLFGSTPRPMFETFVSGQDVVAKYSSWDEAEAGHVEIVRSLTHAHRPN